MHLLSLTFAFVAQAEFSLNGRLKLSVLLETSIFLFPHLSAFLELSIIYVRKIP